MALFGLLGGKSDAASQVKKHAERVANKRIQSPDRWDAIQALAKLGTPEAVAGLLQRFTFYVEPSINDQDEKDAALAGIVAAGSIAIGPIDAFLQRAESISWPVKMLERIAGASAVIERLLALLNKMDTEYERDPQRKIQVLVDLEDRRDPRVAPAVVRFLSDANETVRFHSACTLLAQEDATEHRAALIERVLLEESVRVRVRVLEAFAQHGWSVAETPELAATLRAKLPAGFSLDPKGIPSRKA
jgi:HEAT repeat protein